MKLTATVSIGNSDDKLKQSEWSEFVSDVHDLIIDLRLPIHFHGLSVGSAPWQNACWVVDVHDDGVALRRCLSKLAYAYRQDSIALTLGNTEFVETKDG